jgi:hypothetical protein
VALLLLDKLAVWYSSVLFLFRCSVMLTGNPDIRGLVSLQKRKLDADVTKGINECRKWRDIKESKTSTALRVLFLFLLAEKYQNMNCASLALPLERIGLPTADSTQLGFDIRISCATTACRLCEYPTFHFQKKSYIAILQISKNA